MISVRDSVYMPSLTTPAERALLDRVLGAVYDSKRAVERLHQHAKMSGSGLFTRVTPYTPICNITLHFSNALHARMELCVAYVELLRSGSGMDVYESFVKNGEEIYSFLSNITQRLRYSFKTASLPRQV